MTIGKVHLTNNYARYRIINPKKFIRRSFRTVAIGKNKHTKLIIGKYRDTRKYKAQAVLIAKKDYMKGLRVKMAGDSFKIIKR